MQQLSVCYIFSTSISNLFQNHKIIINSNRHVQGKNPVETNATIISLLHSFDIFNVLIYPWVFYFNVLYNVILLLFLWNIHQFYLRFKFAFYVCWHNFYSSLLFSLRLFYRLTASAHLTHKWPSLVSLTSFTGVLTLFIIVFFSFTASYPLIYLIMSRPTFFILSDTA